MVAHAKSLSMFAHLKPTVISIEHSIEQMGGNMLLESCCFLHPRKVRRGVKHYRPLSLARYQKHASGKVLVFNCS